MSLGKKQWTSSVTSNESAYHLLVPCSRDKHQRTNSQCSFSVVYSKVFVRWCLCGVHSPLFILKCLFAGVCVVFILRCSF